MDLNNIHVFNRDICMFQLRQNEKNQIRTDNNNHLFLQHVCSKYKTT